MRLNYVKRILCIVLCAALMLPVMLSPVSADWWGTGGSIAPPSSSLSDFTIRVGIYYASNALPSANLSNEVGSGYRFGYYDSSNAFHSLGYTYNEDITVLKDSNYYTSGGSYASDSFSGGNLVGAFHLQLPNWFSSYDEALAAAQNYSYGFPAYVNGSYVVRFEYFSSYENAYAAAMNYSNVAVVGGSSTGYTVVNRYSGRILFEYDNYGEFFAIEPISTGNEPQTWFKGYKYFGGFQYARRDEGNLSVTNFVSLDNYTAGVIPYELSASWPIEALKSGAVCARSMAMTTTKHKTFDVCNTTCCQLYRGVYSGTNWENIYRAAHETSGQCAYYNGEYIQAVYCAGTGGFTESAINTWNTDLPYLQAKYDEFDFAFPYAGDSWSYTVSPSQVTAMLQGIGRNCSTIVSMGVTKRTEVGNVLEVTFQDSAGRTFKLTKDDVRCLGNISGVKNMSRCFEIFDASGQTQPGSSVSGSTAGSSTAQNPSAPKVDYSIFTGTGVTTSQTITVMTQNGPVEVSGSVTCITSSGTQVLGQQQPSTPNTGSTPQTPTVTVGTSIGMVGSGYGWTITGRGNGHNVGLSQCGALAMAKLGYSYLDILKYYFTGIEVY